jgi:predicted amidohydrolase YtcJ
MKEPNFEFAKYNNRVKIAGVKIVADGSPQGKTAKMTDPYLTPVPGCAHDCTGITLINQEQLDGLLTTLYGKGIQAFTHCNGDGAIDMYLNAHEKALAVTDKKSKDLRSVIIHSQFMRPDLIKSYAQYGLIPSYFTNHTYFWGDVHMNNMGQERAYFTSPIRSSIEAGITYTNHNDYPITPLSHPMMLSTAVNRTSRSNEVIGPDQRVSAYEALKALTINAAYQYFEEDQKGTLESGKLADLVILSKNPLDIDSDNLKDIQVMQTIKEGVSIFKK